MLTESSMDARLASLSAQQRKELLQRAAAKRLQPPPLQARHGARAPLSFAQRNLWLMNEVESEQYKYNMVSAYSLRGVLDVPALERAFALICDRHQILKSRFVDVQGEPMQEVIDGFRLSIPVVDLTALDSGACESRLHELLLAEGRWLFDLANGPLLRVHLYRLAPDHHVLQLNVHHAIFDGWSKGLLFRELEIAYRALRCAAPVDTAPLPLQFADFAAWQREHLGRHVEEQLAFWRERLSGAAPLLNLPADFLRPAVRSSRGEIVHLHIDAELLDPVHQLARQSGATLYMTMLGAFMLLLHRCTGQRDICVASPVDNRSHPELRRLIGYFLNTVVLRLMFDRGMSSTGLIRAVRQMTLEAFQHQDAPFEQVVSTAAAVRSQSFSPLNQVMFVFQHDNAADPDLEGLQTTKLMGGNETTKYDIYATFKPAGGGLSGWLTYRADLFRSATVESMALSFQALLRAMVEHPDRPLEELPTLDAGARAQVLALSRGSRCTRQFQTLHEAFRARAAQAADLIALIDGDEGITFAALEDSAQRLSSVLRERGVAAGSVVGVHARRGAWYIQALLAIWKVGAAVVPLDTLQGAERLRKILEQVKPCLVLHDQDEAPDFAAPYTTLSRSAAATAAGSSEAVETSASAQAPAFVLFTSGSSGVPKGVIGTHESIGNRLAWQWREYPPPEGEVAAHRVNIGFVDSFTEIWATLLAGKTLAVIDDATLRDPFDFVDALSRHGVTTLYIVPSLLRAVLDAFPELQRQLPGLQRVLLSGEPLTAQLLARFVEAMPSATIVNVYGATEAADASAAAHAAMVGRERVPIGRPLSNMSLYVLDDRLDLCPTGVEGTLHVHGPSLALGYWGDPRLTAARFLPDPYAECPGARMYCLGDRARRLADGSVEYLGRRDRQLKLRGLRIETEEIERVVENCAGVLAACIVAVPTSAGDEALVAYVNVEQDARMDRQGISTYLRVHLPDYMQPNALVLCEELPRTVSGKVDREALRARGLPSLAEDAHVEPRTPTERRLAQIWKDVLRLQQNSITSGFFELGGHSLLAMRIGARVCDEFGIKLSAQEVFQFLTIEKTAAHLDAQLAIAHIAQKSDAAEQTLDVTEF